MLPTGTVTFVFTDIEGSTQLLQQSPEEFPALLERHHSLIRESFAKYGGVEVDTAGDGFFYVFNGPADAILATASAQRAFADFPWENNRIVRVRMGIHTGVGQVNENTYIGLDVHKAARIMSAAYGGQVLLSQSVATYLTEQELEDISLFAIGEFLLKDLQHPETLFQLLIEGASSVLPQPRQTAARKSNLPSRATPLVGREEEIVNILEHIRRPDVRLMTLVGPGGIGKTSLAIEASRAMIDEFEDGVFIVFLAPVKDAQFVPSAIAQVLGFFLHTGIPVTDQLREYIDDKHLLLVLDNFEHLVQAAPTLVHVLEGCPNLKILVTSRSVLKVQWEWEHPVPPLAYAKATGATGRKKYGNSSQSASVELFIQRARAIDQNFTPAEKDLTILAEICDKLDGLPLAIELAAARIKVLSPRTILSRLSKRLDLLRGGKSDLPERHQTLRHAVAWSYDLLKQPEKALFRRLGTFAGGFSLESAEAAHDQLSGIENDGLEIITSLRDQSLIRIADAQAPEPRYMMLETIREYALERLEEEAEMQEALKAHAIWFLSKAEEAAVHFTGSDSRIWLDAVEADLDNYRSALKWAAETGDAKTGLSLCNALWRFWVIRAFLQEGVSHLTMQLANASSKEDILIKAKAMNALGTLLHELSDYKTAHEVLQGAIPLLRETDDQAALAITLNNLSWVAGQTGDLVSGEKYALEACAIHEAIGNRRGVGVSMNNLGLVCFSKSNYVQMREYYHRHYAIMEEIGDKRGMAYSLLCQTYGEQDSGNIHTMQSHIDAARRIFKEIDDRQLIGWASTLQSLLFFHTRKFENARQFLLETVEQATLLHNRLIVSLELVLLGASEMKLGNLEQAKTYLNEALGYASVRGSKFLAGVATRHLAECYLRENNYLACLDFISQSLSARQQISNTIGIVDCGELLARAYAQQGRTSEAIEFIAAANLIRVNLGYPMQDSQRPEMSECLTMLRRKVSDEEFQHYWSAGRSKNFERDLEMQLGVSVHN